MGGTRAFPCMTLEIPRSGPQGSSLPIPDTEPHASSSGCRTEGFAGTHPSVLSTCSNSGKFWTWRSFSMSGAPRWVMPMASTIQQVPGRVSVSQVAQQCCNLLSPPLLSHGTLAGSAPLGQPWHQLGRSCGSLHPAPEGGEGSLCPAMGSSCPSVSGCLCCIFPAFCAPLPDSSPSLWVILGPQLGSLAPAGTPVWALHLCTVAASPPAPALLIHPLSLSVPTPSFCLSLSLSFSFSPLLTGFWVCNF